jgi:hypothetical protein
MSRPDHVIREFNSRNAQSDFTPVVRGMQELQQNDPRNWQQNLERINREVNMRRLGFPDDFQITNVTPQGVFTRSENGRTMQLREPGRLGVQMEGPARQEGSRTERWGRREFNVNPDGSASYTVRGGDNLSHIARDVVSQRMGRAATEQEIAQSVQEIARANNISDPNVIHPGRELRIPPRSQEQAARPGQEQPARPGQPQAGQERPGAPRTPDNPALQVRRDGEGRQAYSAVMPRGLGVGGANGDGEVATREVQAGAERGHSRITGTMRDGYLFGHGRTEFNGETRVDANGRLLSSRVEYGAAGSSGVTMPFRAEGDRTQVINGVRQVETQFNARSGNYETTIRTSDNSTYRSVTRSDGRVVEFRRVTGS